MTVTEDLRVSRPGGGELHLHYRHDMHNPQPVVIFSHGFSVDGTESHRMFLRMAGRYNAAGIATVNFDYFGCGYSDGDFADFSLTNAIDDLQAVLGWAREQSQVDGSRVVVHGQSLGTAVAAVAGARGAEIHSFVLWNLSADLPRRYRKLLGEDLFAKGHTYLNDKGLLVRRAFYEDLERYDVLPLFKSWKRPVLFISCGGDTKGEPELARRACAMAGSLGERVVIDGANHSFKGQPDLEQQAMETTLSWVRSRTGPTAT